ncbi:GNAT family N-acetyltransferase [Commensalibacter oyaizuii]|uniref:GNAT family N-acetyltransferase n=1 Tax=Commensalibacter oyaizuii TaxID=3043873 RepID=A0ABT6Q031_9PROT|nr:GNAT family N-acetyltransferase [Commensalibacter sp. TBRC 16381]MDI2090470.1 GNAT family N-acetyltransferase [Commensalibacter sp. TBRC 16381]
MNSLQIIRVTLDELPQLQDISRQTFFETFASSCSISDMQSYLNNNFERQQLSTEIKNENSCFYFAIYNQKLAGYLKINFNSAQTEFKDPKALEIERIYILQNFQKQRLGQSLLQHAIQIGKQNSLHYIWLGVYEHNNKAIQFYKKNGFRSFDSHVFMVGNDKQIDILMKLDL